MASLAAACNLTRKTEEIEEQLSILQVAPETNKKKSKFPASVRSVKKNTRSRFSKWVRRMPWKRRKEKSVKKSKEEQNTSIIDEEYVAYDDIYQTGTESEYEDIDDEPTEYKKQCSSNKKNAKKHKKVKKKKPPFTLKAIWDIYLETIANMYLPPLTATR